MSSTDDPEHFEELGSDDRHALRRRRGGFLEESETGHTTCDSDEEESERSDTAVTSSCEIIKFGSDGRVAQACVRCRTSKVKCDSLRPACSRCIAAGIDECVYIEAKPRGRKKFTPHSKRKGHKTNRYGTQRKSAAAAATPADDSSLTGAGSMSTAPASSLTVVVSKTASLSHAAQQRSGTQSYIPDAAKASQHDPIEHPTSRRGRGNTSRMTTETTQIISRTLSPSNAGKYGPYSSRRLSSHQSSLSNISSGPYSGSLSQTAPHPASTHLSSASTPYTPQLNGTSQYPQTSGLPHLIQQPHQAAKVGPAYSINMTFTGMQPYIPAPQSMPAVQAAVVDVAPSRPPVRGDAEAWSGIRNDIQEDINVTMFPNSIVQPNSTLGVNDGTSFSVSYNPNTSMASSTTLAYTTAQSVSTAAPPTEIETGNTKVLGDESIRGTDVQGPPIIQQWIRDSSYGPAKTSNSMSASALLLASSPATETTTLNSLGPLQMAPAFPVSNMSSLATATAPSSSTSQSQSSVQISSNGLPTHSKAIPDGFTIHNQNRRSGSSYEGMAGSAWTGAGKRIRLDRSVHADSVKSEEPHLAQSATTSSPLLRDTEDSNLKLRSMSLNPMAEAAPTLDPTEPSSAKAELFKDEDTPGSALRELSESGQSRSELSVFQTLLRLRADSTAISPVPPPPTTLVTLRPGRALTDISQRSVRSVAKSTEFGVSLAAPSSSTPALSSLSKSRLLLGDILPKLDLSATAPAWLRLAGLDTPGETKIKYDSDERIARPEVVLQLLARLKYFAEPGIVGRFRSTVTQLQQNTRSGNNLLVAGSTKTSDSLQTEHFQSGQPISPQSRQQMDWGRAIIERIKAKMRGLSPGESSTSPSTTPSSEYSSPGKSDSQSLLSQFSALQTQQQLAQSEKLVVRLQKAVAGISKCLIQTIGDAAIPGLALGSDEEVSTSSEGPNTPSLSDDETKLVRTPSSSSSDNLIEQSPTSTDVSNPISPDASVKLAAGSMFKHATEAIEALELIHDAVEKLSSKSSGPAEDFQNVISNLSYSRGNESQSQTLMSMVSRLSTVFPSRMSTVVEPSSPSDADMDSTQSEYASTPLSDIANNNDRKIIDSGLSDSGSDSQTETSPMESRHTRELEYDRSPSIRAHEKTMHPESDCGVLTFVLGQRSVPECFCNPKFAEMLGYTWEEMSAILADPAQYEAWITNYNRESYLPMLNAFITSAGYYFRRSVFRNKSGQEQPVLVTYNLYYDHKTRQPLYMLLYVKLDHDRSDSVHSMPEFPPPASDVMGTGPFRGPLQAELVGAMTYPCSSRSWNHAP